MSFHISKAVDELKVAQDAQSARGAPHVTSRHAPFCCPSQDVRRQDTNIFHRCCFYVLISPHIDTTVRTRITKFGPSLHCRKMFLTKVLKVPALSSPRNRKLAFLPTTNQSRLLLATSFSAQRLSRLVGEEGWLVGDRGLAGGGGRGVGWPVKVGAWLGALAGSGRGLANRRSGWQKGVLIVRVPTWGSKHFCNPSGSACCVRQTN